jgi:hypothetical protein
MASKRYVRPSRGGWDILAEGQRRTVLRSATKSSAIARAREIVRREGGGEVRVMNRFGKVTGFSQVRPKSAGQPRADAARSAARRRRAVTTAG